MGLYSKLAEDLKATIMVETSVPSNVLTALIANSGEDLSNARKRAAEIEKLAKTMGGERAAANVLGKLKGGVISAADRKTVLTWAKGLKEGEDCGTGTEQ